MNSQPVTIVMLRLVQSEIEPHSSFVGPVSPLDGFLSRLFREQFFTLNRIANVTMIAAHPILFDGSR